MNNFIYEAPTKVYFGKGEEEKIGKIIKEFNAKKVLIHFGGGSVKKSGLLDKVKSLLKSEGIDFAELGGVIPNPELPLVREGIELCKKEGVDFVLAVGGGSVIDSAKDIANGAANPDIDVWEFSKKKASPVKTIPKGAILTLSAAGSEMSASCVITNPETGEKRGYNSRCNRLDFVIENPELTYTVNPYQTACGAVDISMHTIERYFSEGSDTPLTDSIAEAVIRNVFKAGKDALKNPADYDARATLMWASSLAHNDLTGCGRELQLVVHQFEHELSGKYPSITHGAGLAALWCSWARFAYKSNMNRFLKYAHNVWDVDIDFEHPHRTIEKAIDLQEEYYKAIGMPTSLRELGVKPEDIEELALKCSFYKSRVIGSVPAIGYEDMITVYKMAY